MQGREVRSIRFESSVSQWNLTQALGAGSYILIIQRNEGVFSEGFNIK